MDAITHIQEFGFAFLPGLISPAQCEQYRQMLESDYEKYSPLYASNENSNERGLDNKTNEKVVYNLHNKNLGWFNLFTHPEVIKVLDSMLLDGSYKNSEPYYLNNISARRPLKNNLGQQLHLDSRLPGLNRCIVANVLWAIDDFTEQNGATRVVPGSHKFMNFPEDGVVDERELVITAPKGSAIIFNANLWHRGGGNFDGTSRWALALGYARWFIKPSFDYMKNMPREMFDKLSPADKAIMGFSCAPPKDEFTRLRRRAPAPEAPDTYQFPR